MILCYYVDHLINFFLLLYSIFFLPLIRLVVTVQAGARKNKKQKTTIQLKYENLTYRELVKELQHILLKLKDEPNVTKTQLSSQIRRRTSAPDSRKSSKTVGYFEIAFIYLVIGLIVLFDIVSFLWFIFELQIKHI